MDAIFDWLPTYSSRVPTRPESFTLNTSGRPWLIQVVVFIVEDQALSVLPAGLRSLNVPLSSYLPMVGRSVGKWLVCGEQMGGAGRSYQRTCRFPSRTRSSAPPLRTQTALVPDHELVPLSTSTSLEMAQVAKAIRPLASERNAQCFPSSGP